MTTYAQTRRTEGKPLLLILRELHVNRTFGKLLFQLWKWKQSCFSDQRYQVICLCFRFILLIESHGHSLLKVLEIKMHDLSVFEGLSDERNCGTQEIRWRKDWRKWKRDEGGGGRWGSNQHWAVLHGNLFGFRFSCDTVTNGLQLKERCLQNQGETLQCRAVYFSVIPWVYFWWSDTI